MNEDLITYLSDFVNVNEINKYNETALDLAEK
jgi:hypothetical protein